MRDSLRFIAQRQGRHITIRCSGFDADDHPVCFDIAPRQLRANQAIELDWTTQVLNAERIFEAMIGAGMDDDAAWLFVQAILPRSLSVVTGPVGEGVTQFADEVLEGLDDAGR